MPASNPSPPSVATSTKAGLLDYLAQTVGGVKTFLGLIVASAGIQLALLFNTNGSGASDIAVKLGTSTAEASTNAAARLLSLRTGLNGGAEVESLGLHKGGLIAGGSGFLTLSGAVGARLQFNGAFIGCNEYVVHQNAIRSSLGASASDIGNVIGFSTAAGSVVAGSRMVGFGAGIGGSYTEKSAIMGNGEFEHAVAGAGIVLKSPDGTRWRLTVSNAGALVIAAA
jgi:hypothetical protein